MEAPPGSGLELKSQPDDLTAAKPRLGLAVSINQLRACDVCAVYTECEMI